MLSLQEKVTNESPFVDWKLSLGDITIFRFHLLPFENDVNGRLIDGGHASFHFQPEIFVVFMGLHDLQDFLGLFVKAGKGSDWKFPHIYHSCLSYAIVIVLQTILDRSSARKVQEYTPE